MPSTPRSTIWSQSWSAKFPHVSEADVAAMVSASAASFADARITEFIPVLIGQEVDRKLRATTPRLAG